MKKFTSYLAVFTVTLFIFSGTSYAEGSSADKEAILADCKAEAKGALDEKEYIEVCVQEKEEELKELAKEKAETKKEN